MCVVGWGREGVKKKGRRRAEGEGEGGREEKGEKEGGEVTKSFETHLSPLYPYCLLSLPFPLPLLLLARLSWDSPPVCPPLSGELPPTAAPHTHTHSLTSKHHRKNWTEYITKNLKFCSLKKYLYYILPRERVFREGQ